MFVSTVSGLCLCLCLEKGFPYLFFLLPFYMPLLGLLEILLYALPTDFNVYFVNLYRFFYLLVAGESMKWSCLTEVGFSALIFITCLFKCNFLCSESGFKRWVEVLSMLLLRFKITIFIFVGAFNL